MKKYPTWERLKELFDYHPDGYLIRKVRTSSKVKIGSRAGCTNHENYRIVCVDGKRYYEHPLIFIFFNGWRPKYIDHINRNPLDNRIENLRACLDQTLNRFNAKLSRNNTSGFRGVFKERNGWRARIAIHNSKISLGNFSTKEEAKKAYNTYAKKEAGEFFCEPT